MYDELFGIKKSALGLFDELIKILISESEKGSRFCMLVSFIGYVISEDDIVKDPSEVDAVLQ